MPRKNKEKHIPAGIYRLNPKLIKIWAILSYHQGQSVSRKEILDFCLPEYNGFYNPYYLYHLITMLRKIVGKDKIATVSRYGYMLK